MDRPWIVQKFGGTSVGKFPLKIVDEIVSVWNKNARVVVVCSARSNNVKAQGTTTCLLRAADFAVTRKDFIQVINGIQDDHLTAARAAVSNESILQELEKDIIEECSHISQILQASKILDEVSPRTLDLVMSAGEKLACMFMVAVLRSRNHKANLVDLTRVLDGAPGATPRVSSSANIASSAPSASGAAVDGDFDYNDLTGKITAAVKEASLDGGIPVVTGFFGLISGGLLNAVGRGYTDLCAALCAVGLGASELQIWKEVDGIFTADPRKVPDARLLDQITPEEAAELTYYGSEVIHPFTMSQVIDAHIPIRIKNVMDPVGMGTKVFPIVAPSGAAGRVGGNDKGMGMPEIVSSLGMELGPTAITSKGGIIVLNIISNRTRQSHGFLAQIFRVLDKHRLVVDLISTSEVHVSMAIHESTLEGALDSPLAIALREIRTYGSVTVKENMSIVSLVGTKMKQYVGIAAQMFSTLADAGVNIDMISQGSSEINISCVIQASEVLKAVRVLHAKLLSHAYTLAPSKDGTPI